MAVSVGRPHLPVILDNVYGLFEREAADTVLATILLEQGSGAFFLLAVRDLQLRHTRWNQCWSSLGQCVSVH